ncbi:transcriptional regulator, IclR family [Streptomyces sp. DvalAA-14]|uniref:IclR family transcriptional regulator domain-containing protein n=1 Tax=unclassified Streptomyces TaxID=2593676 RepID=UPI00081B1E76|nr:MULTISPECIES: IclR family transcriptional regulator C-terminal domain-containing protein [unclassified Streptomyces]MYS24282.1 helix-turn-helix domain-containing protein [Streptomyces sp. SID4948]SCE44600.1 transcriptional regulator, IclR family [Streptomyces sp. DvalAA-14]
MTPLATTALPPGEAVGPLLRGMAVLRELARGDGRAAVGDLVRATGLARSTVDRVISTLERVGYLRTDGREAVLAPPLMELGNAYLAASRLPELLGPLADRLADGLDESVSLAVPDRDGVRFVHQATRRRRMSLAFRIGDLLPAERGAPGALFAADWSVPDWQRWRQRRRADPADTGFPALPPGRTDGAATFEARTREAAEAGWSLDDQLIGPGLVALAAPVPDAAGRPVCAVTVVSHTSRHSAASLLGAVLPELRRTVAAMRHTLADPPAPADAGSDRSAVAWSRASKQELGPEFVESLARGLAVLGAFGRAQSALPLTAVAEATGMARATVRRALITLQHLEYLEVDGRLFRPTPRVLELGFAHLSGLTLPQIAEPHLKALVEQVHDSASMAVLDGGDILYVARVPTVRIMTVTITVGTRFPAYATALGRVLLAGLPAVERAEQVARADLTALTPHTVTDPARLAALLEQAVRDRYALVDEELESGLRSIAVPVHDRDGRVVAAVNVSMHASRRTARQAREDLLPPMREAAARIENDLHIAARYTAPPVA